MKRELSIFLWNVNCRGGSEKIRTKLIKAKLDEYEKKPEIIVFTEISEKSKGYEELNKKIRNDGYTIFLSSNEENQVLIAIKKDCIDGGKVSVYEIQTCDYQGKDALNAKKEKTEELKCQKVTFIPDFLLVEFEFQGKKIAIIGCRMKTGQVDLRKNYDDEAVQFYDVLLPELDKIEERRPDYLVLCGDFNNAQCHGKISERFKKDDYKGYAQINYNLHRIKDKLSNRRFIMLDIKNDNPIKTFKDIFPDDHIFVKGSIDEQKSKDSCEPGELKEVKPLDHVYLKVDIIFTEL